VTAGIELIPLFGIGEVTEGERLAETIAAATERAGRRAGAEDVLVVSQKIVSKAEGRVRRLAEVEPSERAIELAATLGKDPRVVELVLSESRRVVRAERGVLIVETHHGWICANAGIDTSNVPGADTVALLPCDPDASARRIRAELAEACGVRPGVIVSDSFGRPWRVGQTDVAIGCAGVTALDDWRGRLDAAGRELAATAIAIADELAAAADLARDKGVGVPVVLVVGAGRWVTESDGAGAGAALRRSAAEDLFR
jgi:coenzyme F420-0:L-glutamate ligase/coenzyme F420-1:gamma-L-glutamate ligase